MNLNLLIMGIRKMFRIPNFPCLGNALKNGHFSIKKGHKQYTPTIHTVFGTALHEAVQHYLTIMYDKSAAAADREDIIGIFQECLREEYTKQYKKNGNSHFSSPEELREFYEDGVNIIEYLKKEKIKIFF